MSDRRTATFSWCGVHCFLTCLLSLRGRLEAENTIQFEKAMRARGLDAVCAPAMVEDLTPSS